MLPNSKPKPLLRGHFHQAMFFVAVGACIPLIFRCQTTTQRVAVIIYTIGVLTMFGVSSLYHRVTWNPAQRALWKKFDHAGIFLMIAGTFTPVALLGLDEASAKTLLIAIWIVAFVGILQSIFFTNLHKMVNAVIYLGAGYMILPYVSELYRNIGPVNVGFIVAGGISYSIGAIAYGLKRPVFNPYIFSYHEFFHIFVNIGATLHFVVVSSLIP